MPSSLHHRAVENLGFRIVDGRLPAGHVMLAGDLEAELDVSRSVVREAVRVLQSLGLVEATKRVGIRVLPPAHWNPYDARVIRWRLAGTGRGAQLRSLTELRTAVEPMAAALAAEHAPAALRAELLENSHRMLDAGRAGDLDRFLELDIRFHTLVLDGSGNEMYRRLAEPIAEVLRGRTDLGLMPDQPHEDSMGLHVAVARAVQGGRPAAARASTARIMHRTMTELRSVWAGEPRPFPDGTAVRPPR